MKKIFETIWVIIKAIVSVIVFGTIIAYGVVSSCWGTYDKDSRDDKSGAVPARYR